jgi:hypothetical protein
MDANANAKSLLSPHNPRLYAWFSAEHALTANIMYKCRTRDGDVVECCFAFEDGPNSLGDTFANWVNLGELSDNFYVGFIIPVQE